MPGLEDLGALAGLAAEGVHDPAVQPFTAEWTDAEPDERAQRVLRWHWRCWADWQVDAWRLNLVVLRDGELVGTQTVSAKNFAVCSDTNSRCALIRRLRLTRTGWEAHRSVPVDVTGLAECLPLFGVQIKP